MGNANLDHIYFYRKPLAEFALPLILSREEGKGKLCVSLSLTMAYTLIFPILFSLVHLQQSSSAKSPSVPWIVHGVRSLSTQANTMAFGDQQRTICRRRCYPSSSTLQCSLFPAARRGPPRRSLGLRQKTIGKCTFQLLQQSSTALRLGSALKEGPPTAEPGNCIVTSRRFQTAGLAWLPKS